MNKKLTIIFLTILSIGILITSRFTPYVSGKSGKNDNLKQVFLKYENKTVYFDNTHGVHIIFNLKEIGDDFIRLESVESPNNRTSRTEIIYVPFSSISLINVSEDTPRITQR